MFRILWSERQEIFSRAIQSSLLLGLLPVKVAMAMRPNREVDRSYLPSSKIMRRVLIALKRAPVWLVTWAQGGYFSFHTCFGRVMAERVSLRHLSAEARCPSRANPSEFDGGQDSTRTSFFPTVL
jgi:hypothetical protein